MKICCSQLTQSWALVVEKIDSWSSWSMTEKNRWLLKQTWLMYNIKTSSRIHQYKSVQLLAVNLKSLFHGGKQINSPNLSCGDLFVKVARCLMFHMWSWVTNSICENSLRSGINCHSGQFQHCNWFSLHIKVNCHQCCWSRCKLVHLVLVLIPLDRF